MRALLLSLFATSLVGFMGCRERHEQPPPIESAAPTSVPAATASASATRPPAFKALELGDAPELPVRDGQRSSGTSIEVRALPDRRPGYALDTTNLRERVPLTRSFRGALLGTPGKLKFVPHEATDVAGLGATPFVLIGAETGLWLHERGSLARRAHLTDVGIRALATNPAGDLLAYATGKGDVEIIAWPSLKLVARKAQWASRLHWSSDGRWLGIATWTDYALLFDAKNKRFITVNTHDDTHDVAPLPGDEGLAIVANDSNALQLYDMLQDKMIAQGQDSGRDLISAAYDPTRRQLIVGGNDNSIYWYNQDTPTIPHTRKTFEADIYGLVCCRKGSLVVAFDERALALLEPSGEIETLVGPLNGWAGTYSGRVALLDDGQIMAVLGGEAFLWNPKTSFVQASEYGRMYQGPSEDDAFSVTTEDIVMRVVRDSGTTIARVRNDKPAMDVEAEPIGSTDVFVANVFVTAAPDGVRIVQVLDLQFSSPPRAEFALLPRGGQLSAWKTAPTECRKSVKRMERGRDDAHWVLVLWDGSLCEVSRDPFDVKALELKVDPKQGRIQWDAKKNQYVAL